MKKSIILSIICAVMGFSFATCKKNKKDPAVTNVTPPPPTPFKADTTVITVDDNAFNNYKYLGNVRKPRSMVYDSVSKSLFFYLTGSNSSPTGYEIVQYSITNGNSAIVYSNNIWSNNNGSEGKNLYIANSELWVPGGANNNKIDRLNIGNFSLSLSNAYNFDNVKVGSTQINSPYDMVQANGNLYVVTMYDNVFYGAYNNIGAPIGLFPVSSSSHGSGIKTVTSGGTQYVAVKCGSVNKIELYSLAGTFVRSIPVTGNNSSPLLKDSKDRLYYFDDSNHQIVRYSGDLLKTEKFPADNLQSFYGLALQENTDHITIYCTNLNGIGMVRLPK